MNADMDRKYANDDYGVYAFDIHGNVHRLTSYEWISDSKDTIRQPRFVQIYIFDPAN